MMCYRDRTYCDFYRDCADGAVCGRALTPGVQKLAEDAEMWISRYTDRPSCYRVESDCEPEAE
jgi:hypothetical protein